MSYISSIIDTKNEQQSVESLNKSLADLAKRLDEIPGKIKPLTNEFDILAQVSRTVESVRIAQYLTGVTNSALDTAKSLNTVYKSQNGLLKVGSSLLGMLGGPLGLGITVASIAASFISFGTSADTANDKLVDISQSVEDLIKKYKELDVIQQRIIKKDVAQDIKKYTEGSHNNLEVIKDNLLKFSEKTEAVPLGQTAYTYVDDKQRESINNFVNEVEKQIKKNDNPKEIAKFVQNFTDNRIDELSLNKNKIDILDNLLGELSKSISLRNEFVKKEISLDNIPADDKSKNKNNIPANDQGKINNNLPIIDNKDILFEKRQSLLQSVAESKLTPLNRLEQDYSSNKDLLQNGIDEMSPLPSETMEDMLARHQQYQQGLTDLEDEYSKQRQEIIDAEQQKRLQGHLELLNSSSQLFGAMGDLIGAFGGESSNAYKAMFAISKGFAIASTTLSMFTNIGKAAEVGFPANIPIIAQATAQGVSIISSIKGTNLSGQAHSGIDYIPREGTWLLDKGERVVDSRTNADLKNFLQSSNQVSSGLNVNVPVTISGGDVSEDEGKQLGIMIKQSVMSIIQEQQRPGGVLNRY